MLTHIHVRDFTIINELDLAFAEGMCVLTGETGAGKSILIGALGLVLGDRADAETVRQGTEKAEVSIIVNIEACARVNHWLKERDLSSGNECHLRRVVPREGPSRAYINGSPASVGMMKTLGEALVDIHGQHQHQSLGRTDIQRQLLDGHAENGSCLERLTQLYRDWQSTKQRLAVLSIDNDERQTRLELLRYQIRELVELGLGETELGKLETEYQRLAHAEQLRGITQSAHTALYEDDQHAVYSQLGEITAQLEALSRLDEDLNAFVSLLGGAQVQIQEAANGLRRYRDNLETDPARLAWIEERLATIHAIARKHHVPAAQLPVQLSELQSELASMESSELDLDSLRARLEKIQAEYRSLAYDARDRRLAAATDLNARITKAMQELGMGGGQFEIRVQPLPDNTEPSSTGLDHVQFTVSTNAGHPPKPLVKVASGGELSRISLAIQMVAASRLSIPTLIFDEVDSGIGGAVAETVGRQLRALGTTHQVLCITHLPQVAAQAHHHYHVRKLKRESVTVAEIKPLATDDRVEEIARMLGGLEMTEQTRAHAAEMITRAQSR